MIEMAALKNSRYKLAGYILVATASAGFHGYYLKTHELLPMWIAIFAFGIAILAVLNNNIYKIYHSKLVYLDALYVLLACSLPLIPLQRGLSILIMMILCCIYAYAMSRLKFE